MPVPAHLEQAASRLEYATIRLQDARRGTDLREWLDALTEHSLALADVQTFANESVHEKLHAVAGREGFTPVRR